MKRNCRAEPESANGIRWLFETKTFQGLLETAYASLCIFQKKANAIFRQHNRKVGKHATSWLIRVRGRRAELRHGRTRQSTRSYCLCGAPVWFDLSHRFWRLLWFGTRALGCTRARGRAPSDVRMRRACAPINPRTLTSTDGTTREPSKVRWPTAFLISLSLKADFDG